MDVLAPVMTRTTTTTMLTMLVVTAMWVGDSSGWKHGWDHSLCVDQPNLPGPGLPDLPNTFSLRVEANLLKKQRTVTLHEYYDYNDNVAAVRMMDSGQELMYFYLYNSNQYLQVTPDFQGGHYCYAQNLNGTDNHDMFGLKSLNSSMDRIFSVKGALHYGGPNIHEKYLGTETVRGIPCNKWQSCQYWPELDATSSVLWYFSDTKQWSSITGLQTPVRCHVTGTRWVNQTYSYIFEHIYEFYDFQADLTGTDTHFEVPTNTICFSENNTKPLPTLPPAYSFDVEILDVNTNTISFMREEYDSKTNMLRLDYRETPQANSPYETRYVSQYHDFNTGMAYIIDVVRANCTTSVIPRDGFDDIDVSKGDVRFRNPNEFLDLNHNYVYQGVRTTRGIDCDTWAVQRFDYPDTSNNNNLPTVWTWYFATEDWMRSMGFKDNLVMPVMLEIFGDNPQGKIHKQTSYYEYNVDEPNFLTWDLSACYGASQSRNYAFLVQGRFGDVVKGNLMSFKYYVLASLQVTLGVAPLRVARMDVQEAGSNTLVTFDLLDKATLPGDVVRINEEPDLQTAFTRLNNSVYAGTLKILAVPPGTMNVQALSVLPAGSQYQLQSYSSSSRQKRSSFTAPAPSSSGYSAGSMGGMAVGMLVLGALVGFVVMFVIYKARGGTLMTSIIPMRRFENEKE